MEKMRMHKKMAMSGKAPSMKKYQSGGMTSATKRDKAKTDFNKKAVRKVSFEAQLENARGKNKNPMKNQRLDDSLVGKSGRKKAVRFTS